MELTFVLKIILVRSHCMHNCSTTFCVETVKNINALGQTLTSPTLSHKLMVCFRVDKGSRRTGMREEKTGQEGGRGGGGRKREREGERGVEKGERRVTYVSQ